MSSSSLAPGVVGAALTTWQQGGVTLAADFTDPAQPVFARVTSCKVVAADATAPAGANVGYVVTFSVVGMAGAPTASTTSPVIYEFSATPYTVTGPDSTVYQLSVFLTNNPAVGQDCSSGVTFQQVPAGTRA